MKYTTISFIEKANVVHNNKYDYSLSEYIKNNVKIKIICPIHGIFEQTPVSHIRNNKPRGCPSCAGKNKTTNQFISEAKEIHGDKYDYSKVEYINAAKPITIICLIHGEFKQKPNNHLNGNNCPKCVKIIHTENRTYSTSDFIKKANQIHNNKYNYTKTIYSKSRNNVDIICPIHGKFTQKANSHLNGHGCPDCNESKGELKIKEYLNDNMINFIYQKTFNECQNKNNRKLKFDFYLPELNILIEYDGKQHFEPIEYFGGSNSYEKLKEYDEIKNNFSKQNDINLIRISYIEYDKINNILNKKILINKKDYSR